MIQPFHRRKRRRAAFSLSDWDYMPMKVAGGRMLYNAKELTAVLRARVREIGSLRATARAFQMDVAYISRVLNGHVPMTAKLARKLGYVEVTRYRKAAASNRRAERRFPYGMNADDHAATCDIRTSRDGWDADCTCGVRPRTQGAEG